MINVLIIDDDAMVAELNRRYVAQIPGFQCCGTASTLEKAKEIIFNSDYAYRPDIARYLYAKRERARFTACPA